MEKQMGRISSGKPAKDVEAASESLIDGNLGGSILQKSLGLPVHASVGEALQSGRQIDDVGEKKQRSGKNGM